MAHQTARQSAKHSDNDRCGSLVSDFPSISPARLWCATRQLIQKSFAHQTFWMCNTPAFFDRLTSRTARYALLILPHLVSTISSALRLISSSLAVSIASSTSCHHRNTTRIASCFDRDDIRLSVPCLCGFGPGTEAKGCLAISSHLNLTNMAAPKSSPNAPLSIPVVTFAQRS